MYILTADIGGTNSRFSLFRVHNFTFTLVHFVNIASQTCSNLTDLIKKIQKENWEIDIKKCKFWVLSIAGRIKEGKFAYCPNLNWTIDLSKEQDFPQNVLLLNDFSALAWSGLYSELLDLREIQKAQNQDTNCAFIGAGTGFGTAVLLKKPVQQVLASEYGHGLFPFLADEFAYANFLHKQNIRYLDIDEILSARGLEHLYLFHHKKQLSVRQILSQLEAEDPVFRDFSKYYGRIAKDFALSSLCFGSLYIAGGIAQTRPEILESTAFSNEFLSHDKFSKILEEIPIYLIQNPQAALYGALAAGCVNYGVELPKYNEHLTL